MDIQKLSSQFQVRVLTEKDIDQILNLMAGNPLFFQHCPPVATRDSIQADMKALPPRTTYADKFYVGFFDGQRLVAVLDLILRYPNAETAFIGFFMLEASCQGSGLGTAMVTEIISHLHRLGFRYTRLGYVKGNPQSRSFWHKNGFLDTGVESKTENYTIVVLQRDNLCPPIITKRLVLHPFLADDRTALSALLKNDAVGQTYMIPAFPTAAALEQLIDRLFAYSQDEAHFVRGIYLHDQLIGLVNDVQIRGPSIELGYVIHPDHWNQGYATEMLQTVIDYLHRTGHTVVRTGAFSENGASLRVMEKCGMHPLAEREIVEYRGKKHTCLYFEV